MCGVFGFFGNGAYPDLDLIEAVAHNTETRGRDAWGVAWIDSSDRLRRMKGRGPISLARHWLAPLADAKAMIGHCRFATHGSPRDNDNNHPHPVDGGWLVHNGVVRNDDELAEALLVGPSSECDSELLALSIEERSGTLLERSAATIEASEGAIVVLGLWTRPQRLVIARRDNPLSCWSDPTGSLYLASLPHALPKAASIRNATARMLTVRNGLITSRIQDLSPCPNEKPSPCRPGKNTARLSGINWSGSR